MRKTNVILLGLVVLLAAPAFAQRTNPLEGQPAVRKRLLLRSSRFEAAPVVGVTLNRDFFHTFLGGIKLEYHFNDWISVGGMFAGGAYNMETGLTDNLIARLPKDYNDSTEERLVPSRAMAKAAMLRLQYLIGAEINATPFFGKMALFQKLFFNYDFYAFGGAGFAGLANKCTDDLCYYLDENGTRQSFSDKFNGLKIGGTWGVGAHLFFNNWVALNLELRDTIVRDNLAGRDMNWDPPAASGMPVINEDDVSFDHIFAFFLGASFYFPTTVEISR